MSEGKLREELAAARQRIAELESGGTSDASALNELLFEHAPGGIALVALNGKVLLCNREGARILGHATEEVVGHNTAQFYDDPSDKTRLRAVLAEGGMIRDYQVRMKHAEGRTVWVNLNASQVTYQGKPAAMVSFTDITEYRVTLESLRVALEGVEDKVKLRTSNVEEANEELAIMHLQLIKRDREREQAKRALQESEERFRAIFENKHSVMFIIDPATGRIEDANQAAASFYGYSLEQLKAMTIMEINTLSPREVAEEMQRVKREEREYFEFRHRLSNGEIRDVEVFSGPVQVHGKPLLYSIIHDISGRKRAEEILRVYKRVIMSTPDLIALVDRDYVYRMVNDAHLKAFGKRREEVEGIAVSELIGRKAFDETVKECLDKAFSGETIKADSVIEVPNRRPIHLSVTYHPVRSEGGEIDCVSVDARDVTDIRGSQKALKEFSQRLALATDAGMIGIWELDVPTRILNWDAMSLQLFRKDPAEFSGMYEAWRVLIHPDDLIQTEEGLQAAIDNNTPFEQEYRILWPNGEIRYMKADALMQTDSSGKVARVTGVHQDVTETRMLEEELRTLATTDPLTGANNRRRFVERSAEEFDRSRRYNTPTSMITIDIDHFKRVNDTYGHHVGDSVLRELVAVCRRTLRTTDIFARMGGEEFSVLLPETSLNAALRTAERLRVAVEESVIEAGDKTFGYTISLGVSQVGMEDENIGDAMRRADKALYAAKDAGRNQVMSE